MQGTTYIWAASTAINQVYVRSDTPDVELCVECRQYTHYRQTDSNWSSDIIGTGTKNFRQIGCAVTSLSIVTNTIPKSANQQMTTTTDPAYQYIDNNLIQWQASELLSGNTITYNIELSASKPIKKGIGFTEPPYSISVIDQYLQSCKSVVIGIHGIYTNCDGGSTINIKNHFIVVVKKTKTGSYLVYDPANYFNICELPGNAPIYAYHVFTHNP